MTNTPKPTNSRKARLWSLLIGLTALVFVFAASAAYHFTTPQLPSEHSGLCTQIDAATLELSGTIDEGMKACAEAMLTPEIDTVIVRSPGGDTMAGRAIAIRLASQPRTLIIDTYCVSSCANYLVPAADRVQLRPKAIIGLHGTPDPKRLVDPEFEGFLEDQLAEDGPAAESIRRTLEFKRSRARLHLTEEAAFAEQFGVPHGWRLYMDSDDNGRDWLQYFTPGSGTNLAEGSLLIVEQPMLASCLPRVKIEGYQTVLENTVFKKSRYWNYLKDEAKAYRSGALTCLKSG